MTSHELRTAFVDYFVGRDHTSVPSSPVVITDDPSLLFTNAGMNQFKTVFLGLESRPYRRAVSVQKCFRVSGKHNDLENVGVTPRHHTFFEMLGNFSFGDYFKEEAIVWGWEFVTKTLGLPPEKLWATVHTSDDEAHGLWERIAPEVKPRLRRFEEENYWSMGDTGPCGPCSEIHFDQGEALGCGRPECTVNCECDRYLEIWNLVFMQYDRQADGTIVPLPKPSVDTGAGFERILAVMQGVQSNYETDLFRPILESIGSDAGVPYEPGPKGVSHQVCADHLRALAFGIADGGQPSNEGAGYVLRRILRRAARHGKKLGLELPFLYGHLDELIGVMGDAYPELRERREHIAHVIRDEEERFAETLDAGLAQFERARRAATNGVIAGADAFKLYDTFGFPLDLTEVLAGENGLSVDREGFEAALTAQRERSRAGGKFAAMGEDVPELPDDVTAQPTPFRYDGLTVDTTVRWASDGAVVLEETPFYADAGGQIDDVGTISGDGFTFAVERMHRVGEVSVHVGRWTSGDAAVAAGTTATASVDAPRRRMIQRNHTATHLLHKALQIVLGRAATQSGSLVAPDRLRFDFAQTGPMSGEHLATVERIVNEAILENTPIATEVTDYDAAIAGGAMALFGEKYADRVRVVKVGDLSAELCGGTHVVSTGEIGQFRIVTETGVAAGIRRIEAVTGEEAYALARRDGEAVGRAAELLQTADDKLVDRIAALREKLRATEAELRQLKRDAAKNASQGIAPKPVGAVGSVFLRLESGGRDEAMMLADQLKGATEPLAGFIATQQGNVVVALSPSATKLGLKAGDLLKTTAGVMGGRGGGRADFAQGQIKDTGKWDEAESVWEGELSRVG